MRLVHSEICELGLITRGYAINALKSATVRRYEDKWENDVKKQKPNLWTCIKFKVNFSREPYLNLVNAPKYRWTISQLMVSSRRLAIKTGLDIRPPIPTIEIICIYSHLQNDDDEKHSNEFHFHASELDDFNEIVQKYVSQIITKSNLDKFIDILPSPDGDVLRKLGKYNFNSLKKT